MHGEGLGRRALRLDAAYCACGGALAVGGARPLASLFGLPPLAVATLGAAAVAWAALLLALSRRSNWRRPVAVVGAANLLAAAAFAGLAAGAPRLAAQLLLAAVAGEVIAFAGVQALALRRT